MAAKAINASQFTSRAFGHDGVEARALAAANHRLRMLGAKISNREIHDGHVHEAEDRQGCR